MINRINLLKDRAIERANYYSKIDFPNLAEEFSELANILVEIEAIIKERDELKAQLQRQSLEAPSNPIVEQKEENNENL